MLREAKRRAPYVSSQGCAPSAPRTNGTGIVTEVRKYGSTEVQKYGSTEVRNYRSTELQKYGITEVRSC
ncbi:MAG TPA: hypothetical protein DCZ59_00260 [Bacteroidetes bacterium]|nr:hypothetical protein [Bacteroidota bacterium]